MRLKKVERGGPAQKLWFALFRVVSGQRAPDVVRVLRYRRDFFGRHFSQCVQHALRGPSTWSVAERELIAAFVSHSNRCRFCTSAHAEVARAADSQLPVGRVLEDLDSAPISARLRAALAFAGKLTLEPQHVTGADAAVLGEAGLARGDIQDVIYITGLFNIINRIADTLGFEVPSPEAMAKGGQFILKRGYVA